MGRYRRGDIYRVAFPIVSNLAGSFLLGRLCLSDLYNDKNAKGKLCVRHKGDNCRIKISRCWAMPLLCQDSTDISVQQNFMVLGKTWTSGLGSGLACCFVLVLCLWKDVLLLLRKLASVFCILKCLRSDFSLSVIYAKKKYHSEILLGRSWLDNGVLVICSNSNDSKQLANVVYLAMHIYRSRLLHSNGGTSWIPH